LSKDDYQKLIAESLENDVTVSRPNLSKSMTVTIDLTEDDEISTNKPIKERLLPTPSEKVEIQLNLLEVKEQTFVKEDFDVYENAKKMSDSREAEAEIEKLERQLQDMLVKRQQKEIARIQRRKGEEVKIRKKYFSEAPSIPKLTPEMLNRVEKAWKGGQGKVMAELGANQCTGADLQTLVGRKWLNDEVINFYFQLMMERAKENPALPQIHAFSTFLYPTVKKRGHSGVKRWTRKVDLFAQDIILFPIHLGVHWTLAAALVKKKEIVYLDSMGSDNSECRRLLLEYLETEHMIKKKEPLDAAWTSRSLSQAIPQQDNSSDCGVFCCKFGDYLARGLMSFNFGPEHMQIMRKAICLEILSSKLLF